MSTNTTLDDTDAIAEVAAAQSSMNQTLQALAEEVGLTTRDLETGADPAELEAEAEKAALFGAHKAAAEKADDDRAPAQVAADLLEQNAANVARIAEAAGVSKRDIALDPGASKLQAQKAAALGIDADAEKSMTDAEKRDRLHKHMFGPSGSPDLQAGDAWRDADPDPAAGDRRD